jgi:hypothetical protein
VTVRRDEPRVKSSPANHSKEHHDGFRTFEKRHHVCSHRPKGQRQLTVHDVIARVPEGMSCESVRFATLQLLRSGEVDLSDDQRLFLTVPDAAVC